MTYRELIEKQTITERDIYEMSLAVSIIETGDYLNENVFDALTGAVKKKVQFIRDFAEQAGRDIKEIVLLFKDTRVFKFFKMISFNIGKLWSMVKKGFRFYTELQKIIARYISETRVLKWTEGELKKLDEYLQEHPKLKRVGGVAVAGLLLFIWTRMSFTGDFVYDFDWSDLLLALSGTYTLHKLFSGEDGTRLLMLFASGVFLGLSFPWGGTLGTKFVAAVATGLYKIVKR